jgi:hypothetical protein
VDDERAEHSPEADRGDRVADEIVGSLVVWVAISRVGHVYLRRPRLPQEFFDVS